MCNVRSVAAVPCIILALAGCGQAQEPVTQQAPLTQDQQDALVAAATTFIGQLATGDYAAAVATFDPTMTRVMPAAKLEQAWKGLLDRSGAFQRQVEATAVHAHGDDIVVAACEFAGELVDVRIVYDAQQRISGLWFSEGKPKQPYVAPAYVNRDGFTDIDVTVGEGKWALPGTLSIPKGDGPFPAIVLVHGSGPQDRDESIGPNKPFCDLAWGLASRGIAVLRYEKRTKAHAAEMAEIQTTLTVKEETIDDAIAAVALLRARPEIAPGRVFVLGHSLGGNLAPRIGLCGAEQIAGLIIMAGTTRPLEDVTIEQVEYLLSLEASITPEARQALEDLKAQAARVKDPNLSAATPPDQLPLGVPAAYWLDLRAYDPIATAKQLSLPVLVLQGGRDYQVTIADYDGWKRAFECRTDVEFHLYPDLNHLFATGEGMATPAEYAQPTHVAEPVVADIAAWVAAYPPTP